MIGTESENLDTERLAQPRDSHPGNTREVSCTDTARTSAVVRRSNARWWVAVLAGLTVMLPFSWLLSHVALLPFLLGLFFFVLFGLVVGAVVHRIAAPGRPYSQGILVVGTTLIVVVGWLAGIVQESRDSPAKLAEMATTRVRDIGDRTGGEFRADVADQVRNFLRERYPPGGTIGYAVWSITSGELKRGDIEGVNVTMVRPQRRYSWGIRVILSVALLGFGVGSQTFLLGLDKDPVVRAMDRE